MSAVHECSKIPWAERGRRNMATLRAPQSTELKCMPEGVAQRVKVRVAVVWVRFTVKIRFSGDSTPGLGLGSRLGVGLASGQGKGAG